MKHIRGIHKTFSPFPLFFLFFHRCNINSVDGMATKKIFSCRKYIYDCNKTERQALCQESFSLELVDHSDEHFSNDYGAHNDFINAEIVCTDMSHFPHPLNGQNDLVTVNNFNEHKMRVVATWRNHVEDPITTFSKVGGNFLDFESGWAVSIIRDLSVMLNFTIEAIRDDRYIYENTKGVLSGPGEMVVSGTADVVIGKMYILQYRLKWMTAAHQVSSHRLSLLFLQPNSSVLQSVYTNPFQVSVWCLIVATVLLSLISALCINKLEEKYEIRLQNKEFEIIPCLCATFLNQSYAIPPTYASKIIFAFTIFAFIIIWTSYSAFLTSALTRVFLPISSIKDFAKHHYHIIFPEYNRFACNYYYELQEGKSLDTTNDRCNHQSIGAKDDEMQRMFMGENAIIRMKYEFALAAAMINYTDQQICQVSHFSLIDRIPATAAYLQKGSPWAESFNRKLILLKERGYIDRYSKILVFATDVLCETKRFVYQGAVEFEDILLVFYFVAIGAVASCLILMVEKLFKFFNTV